MKRITIIAYLAATLLAAAMPVFGTSPAQADIVVAKAMQPPTWPALELHSEKCDRGGQRILAYHFREGGIKGCWTRAMGVVLVIWDDEDMTVFKDTMFFKPQNDT